MKTNPTPTLKILKPSTVGIITIAIAALAPQLVRAQAAPNQIVLTENSSTSLTATYNGSTSGVTVTFLGPDYWNVTFPSTVFFRGTTTDWTEPGNSTLSNQVIFGATNSNPNSNQLSVVSDSSQLGNTADGSTVVVLGADSSNGAGINATFFDNGDVAGVPDTGSTFGLLLLALVALMSAGRFCHLQLA